MSLVPSVSRLSWHSLLPSDRRAGTHRSADLILPNANGLFAQEDAILEIDACEFTAYGSAGLRTSTASCIGGLGRTLCFGGGFDGTGNVVPGPGEVNGNLATTLCTPPLTLWPPGLVKRE